MWPQTRDVRLPNAFTYALRVFRVVDVSDLSGDPALGLRALLHVVSLDD